MIKLFVTGGTFDKEYNELTEKLYFKETHVPEMLTQAKCRVSVDIRTLMLVDSLEMSDADRELIAKSCIDADTDTIVITHGTGTMEITAKFLADRVKDKTVVITGAMRPYTFRSSDGFFNLGAALAFAQSLPHGVYVAMNGRYFTADNVTKNTKLGEFEETTE